MSFGWLEKLGVLAPVIMSVIPGAQPFIPIVISAMTIAENSKQPGAKKRDIGMQAVEAAATAINQIHPNSIDVNQAKATYDNVVDTVVAVTNQVHNIPIANPVK